MKHLFLFTIGPVQSFIAQARKTQDLYAGSQILTKLIKKAIAEIPKEQLVFPQNTEGSSLPNHFLAVVDNPENKLIELGDKIKKSVSKEWEQLVVNPMMKLALKIAETQNVEISFKGGIQQQIDNHLEIYWLFEPIDKEDYKTAYDNIQKNLAGLKNIRPFKQFNNGLGERGRKCSLDGQRNIKFYRKSEKQKDIKDNSVIKKNYLFDNDNLIIEYENKVLPHRLMRPGEGLSAVSFAKRYFQEEFGMEEEKPEFDSTADIALLDVIDFWKRNYKDELKEFKQSFKNKDFNAQLYFEDSYNDSYFKKQGYAGLVNEIPKLKMKLDNLTRYAKENDLHLSKYYAVLTFDGDSMGQWLSGNSDYLKDGEDLRGFQVEMSKSLGKFAEKAKSYLDADNRGRSVYAGGDDFLGFVNLNHLFQVVSTLQHDFEIDVSTPLSIHAKEGKKLTFSAGISIAHYKEPLSLVLSKAREMQKKAKEVPDKSAYGIGVIKASGETEETIWRFADDSLGKLQQLTEALRDEKVSNTFIKNFEREFLPLTDSEGEKLSSISYGLLRCEFERLMLKNVKKQDKEDIKQLAEDIWSKLYRSNNQATTLSNFFKALSICDFLHRSLHPKSKKTLINV